MSQNKLLSINLSHRDSRLAHTDKAIASREWMNFLFNCRCVMVYIDVWGEWPTEYGWIDRSMNVWMDANTRCDGSTLTALPKLGRLGIIFEIPACNI
jgi:hypothetical protein